MVDEGSSAGRMPKQGIEEVSKNTQCIFVDQVQQIFLKAKPRWSA